MEQHLANFGEHYLNVSCDYTYIPSAIEQTKSLNSFGVGFLSSGVILSVLTLYLAVDGCNNVLLQKESELYKTSSIFVLLVYPIASVCSLTAIAVPRAQLLSEAVTQIFLAISLYRLYLLLIDIGRKKLTKPPPLVLRVPPCCCWPCVPLPKLELNDPNLSRLRMLVLQLPIVQGIIYCAWLCISVDDPRNAPRYNVYFQPFCFISILLGLYGVNSATKSLHEVIPEEKLNLKTIACQLILVFTKLQALIVRNLSNTGLFPCTYPMTPQVYANALFNMLVLIEMMFVCCGARYIYHVDLVKEAGRSADSKSKSKSTAVDMTNNNNINEQLSVNSVSELPL